VVVVVAGGVSGVDGGGVTVGSTVGVGVSVDAESGAIGGAAVGVFAPHPLRARPAVMAAATRVVRVWFMVGSWCGG